MIDVVVARQCFFGDWDPGQQNSELGMEKDPTSSVQEEVTAGERT